MGLQHSYVELALSSTDEAWKLIRTVLRDGGLPRRTWPLFHDDELRGQWLGLYDDTPAPPMPSAE